MSKPVLCAGRLYCDLVFADVPRLPTLGTEVFAPSVSLHAGGGAFITGATLSALLHPVALLSTLPAAPFDTIVLADMATHGLSATRCEPSDTSLDPQITVAIATQDDRAFLTRAAGPALPDFADMDFSSFAHLHIGELRTLQDAPTLIEHARAAGLTISLDCGWQDDFDPSVAELIASVDIFLPNECEARALTARGIPETCAALTVVKSGNKGARGCARSDAEWTHCGIPANVTVRDATGAGDAFNAGFLTGWLDQASLRDCLANGNACGASAVQVVGGIGAPK